VMEQRGMTWGGTLTDGFDGGRMPEAPALAGTVLISTMAEPTPAVMARPARASNLDTARAPVWYCRVTLPLPPRAQEMDQPGQRNIFDPLIGWAPGTIFERPLCDRDR
jgi:hypothetical protein